jgi:uncharacterized protein
MLAPVTTLNCPPWAALSAVDDQKAALDRNLRQFLRGLPANNVLLTGSRGCGKSSLIKALLPRYAKKGLRLVEVDRDDLIDLPDITARLENQPFSFILFADDLVLRIGRRRLQAFEGGAGWFGLRFAGECADLRHLEPASSDAGVFRRKPGNPAPRQRSAAG